MTKKGEKDLFQSEKNFSPKYHQLNKNKKNQWYIYPIIILVLAGLLDYYTGPEIASSIIYLIPVMLSAWFTKKYYAIIISILSATTWMIAEITSGRFYSHIAIHFWNTITILVFFLVVAMLLIRLRTKLNSEQILSRMDYLTGTMNPRAFYEFMDIEIERSKRYGHSFTIAYIDMDNFKKVNDKFGHPVGDNVLIIFADILKNNLRRTDVIARLGGDEFVLLFPETEKKEAKMVIEKVKKSLNNDKNLLNNYSITYSIGVLTCKNDYPSTDKIMQFVDSLMYSVKKSGKNAIKYSTYKEFKNKRFDPSSTNNK